MKKLTTIFAGCWIGLACWLAAFAAETNEILLADFDGDTWGNWEVKGDAFGPGPAHGALPGQQPISGFLGRGLANSFAGGDKSTGTLTSAEFTITKPYINFLIGGGNHPGEACINLLIDGQAVSSATGAEFEQLSWHTWQLFPVMNKQARLQI